MIDRETTLPLFEETVDIERQRVVTGRVQVHVVPVINCEPVQVALAEETVSIDRIAVGRFVDTAPAVRIEGDTTIIPVLEEHATVTVRLFLREEVRLRRVRTTRIEQHAIELRRDAVTVARLDPKTGDESMTDHDPMPTSTTSTYTGVLDSQPPSGAHHVAALFATRAAADRAAEDLTTSGIALDDIDLIEEQRGGAPEGGGIWESIKRLFSSDEANYYYEGVNRGQTLLTIKVPTAIEAERVATLLERHDPIDLDAQETGWRNAGWEHETGATARDAALGHAAMGESSGAAMSHMAVPEVAPVEMEPTEASMIGESGIGAFTPAKPPMTTAATGQSALAGRSMDVAGEAVIPVVEENIAVGKRSVAGGKVRVYTSVVSRPVEEDVRLREERVHIDRHPVDRAVGVGEDPFRERSIEMTETSEEAVIAKTVRVVEEIVVGKQTSERTEHVSDTARRTEVTIEDDRVGTHHDAAAVRP